MNALKNELNVLQDQLRDLVLKAIVSDADKCKIEQDIKKYVTLRRCLNNISDLYRSLGEYTNALKVVYWYKFPFKYSKKRKLEIKEHTPISIPWEDKDVTNFVLDFANRATPETLDTYLCIFVELIKNKTDTVIEYETDDLAKAICGENLAYFIKTPVFNEAIRKNIVKECKKTLSIIEKIIGPELFVIPSIKKEITIKDFIGISELLKHLDKVPSKDTKKRDQILDRMSEVLKTMEENK